MKDRLERIRRRLEVLRRADPGCQVFGASMHRYELRPAAAAESIAAFERTHGVALPDEYRAFLQELGDGGAGPYYGLSPLAPLERQELPQQHVVVRDQEGKVVARSGTGPRVVPDERSSTARPFTLAGPWKPSDGPLPVLEGTSPYDGAVHLAEIGCGYFAFLVVNGPRRGEVWADYTAGDGAIRQEHDGFLSFYEDWLDRAFVEWAEITLPRLIAGGASPPDGVLDEVAPLVEREAADAPDFFPAHRRLGYVRLQQGRHDDAVAAFRRASETSTEEPLARLHLDLARTERLRGQPPRALEQADQGLAQDGLWFSTRLELLRERQLALAALGRRDEAVAVLEAIVEIGPHDRGPFFSLALARLEDGDLARARQVIEQVVERGVECPPGATPADRRRGVIGAFLARLEAEGRADLSTRFREALPPEPAATGWAKQSGGWKKN